MEMIEMNRRRYLPNMTLDCPWMPGKYYTYINESSEIEKEFKGQNTSDIDNKSSFGIELPNGRYRYSLKFSTKTDPFVYFVQWQTDIRIRMNDENF
jgi:hypothetical protein